jgi:hypothetical protein
MASQLSFRSLMRAELSRPSGGVYTGAMLVAATCPQCRDLGFIPKHMLPRVPSASKHMKRGMCAVLATPEPFLMWICLKAKARWSASLVRFAL